MKTLPAPKQSTGFTIIELLISTAVFSIIMLVITAGVIGFTRQYYKGVVASSTQTAARQLMSEITQAIQFGGSITTGLNDPGTGTDGFCVDNKLYSYIIGQQVSSDGPNAAMHQAYHGLVVDNAKGSCDAATPTLPTTAQLVAGEQRELLGDKMRLAALEVSSEDSVTYVVHIRILYGEDDVLEPDPAGMASPDWSKENCKLDHSTLQYCSATELTTTVQKRLQ
jgi:prepilin-type N-terminal cleavage/methylation domain-containing protein